MFNELVLPVDSEGMAGSFASGHAFTRIINPQTVSRRNLVQP